MTQTDSLVICSHNLLIKIESEIKYVTKARIFLKKLTTKFLSDHQSQGAQHFLWVSRQENKKNDSLFVFLCWGFAAQSINEVMSSTVSIVRILSPETDNCPSWSVEGREWL